jgi:hypothetical protein
MNLDLMKYVSKGAIAFGIFSAYDVLVQDREFSGFASKDGLTFALSTIAAEWTADILSGVWNMNENSITGMVSKPLLNGIIYMYLYNYMVRDQYEGGNDNSRNFLMAALGEVLLSYVANPIASLFGNYRQYN